MENKMLSRNGQENTNMKSVCAKTGFSECYSQGQSSLVFLFAKAELLQIKVVAKHFNFGQQPSI